MSMSVEKLTLEEWLLYNGFVDNPFKGEARRAENDDRLYDCFEKFPYYDEVKGSPHSRGSCFIFTARGGGKSALCRQIQSELDETLGEEYNRILVILYNDFELIQRQFENNLRENDVPATKIFSMHIEEIIKLIIIKLFEIGVQRSPKINLGSLKRSSKHLLRWYIDNFSKCLQPWELDKFLGQVEGLSHFINVEDILKGAKGIAAMTAKGLPEAARPVVETLLEIVNWKPPEVDKSNVPSSDLLKDLVDICQELNINSIYILVDNVDQERLAGKNSDFRPALNLIRPLGTASDILCINGLVFKFFLPLEIADQAKDYFRFDILPRRDIAWGKEDIKRILQKRLCVFSKNQYESLAPLCEKGLDAQIDDLIVKSSDTPRDLIELGYEIFQQHFKDSPTSEPLLTWGDWQAAWKKVSRYRQNQSWRA